MRLKTVDLLFVAAILIGALYFTNRWTGAEGSWTIAEKGACVSLLAVWAGVQARSLDGWLIALVLALGAGGDVLLETHGLVVGALTFLAGHVVAIAFYLRNRRGPLYLAATFVCFAAYAFTLPSNRPDAPGILLYASGLSLMAGTAWISRFPRIVGVGGLLFVASDLLIFARLGPLHDSIVPELLIWPLYVAGQALIAWGVVTTLRSDEDLHHRL